MWHGATKSKAATLGRFCPLGTVYSSFAYKKHPPMIANSFTSSYAWKIVTTAGRSADTQRSGCLGTARLAGIQTEP